MSNLVQQLEHLQQAAQEALLRARSTEETKAWYSEYLGRKGRLTSILRNLGSLPSGERLVVGKAANEVKASLELALQERQDAIAWSELESAQRTQVDVTLPGRPQTLGRLHPTTRT